MRFYDTGELEKAIEDVTRIQNAILDFLTAVEDGLDVALS